MSTLRKLLDEGRSVEVDSPYGLFVGAVWPTFQTGVNAGRHGRYCFGQLVPGMYHVRRTAGNYAQQPFWSTMNDAGRRSAVITCRIARGQSRSSTACRSWTGSDTIRISGS